MSNLHYAETRKHSNDSNNSNINVNVNINKHLLLPRTGCCEKTAGVTLSTKKFTSSSTLNYWWAWQYYYVGYVLNDAMGCCYEVVRLLPVTAPPLFRSLTVQHTYLV